VKALRALWISAIAAFVFASLMAVGAAGIAHRRAWLAGVLAFLICTAAGALVTVKRTLAAALLAGLEGARVGEAVCRGLSTAMAPLAPGAARLPLADAERALRAAVERLAGQGRVQRLLVERIASITLARFRAEGAAGVDVGRVLEELAGRIDALLAAQISRAVWRATLVAFLAAGLLSLAVALALRVL